MASSTSPSLSLYHPSPYGARPRVRDEPLTPSGIDPQMPAAQNIQHPLYHDTRQDGYDSGSGNHGDDEDDLAEDLQHEHNAGPYDVYNDLNLTQTASANSTAKTPKSVLKNPIQTLPSGNGGPEPEPNASAVKIALTDPMGEMRERNIDPITGLPNNSPVMLAPTVTPEGTDAADAKFRNKGYFDDYHIPVEEPKGDSREPSIYSDTGSVFSLGDDYDYDDFHWSDDEAVEEANQYEEQLANERKVRIGRFSLMTIVQFLCFTFLGNLFISIVLIIPVLALRFLWRPARDDHSPGASRKRYLSDNVEAWLIWASVNLHISWWLNALVRIIPTLVSGVIRIVWGSVNQQVKTVLEAYNTVKTAISPIFYAAAAWIIWDIIFIFIYSLYTYADPSQDRASYTYRGSQVIQLIFFATLTYCVEQILIKLIALNFHKTAYCERLENVSHNLKVFDTLKDSRPHQNPKKKGKGSAGPGGQNHADAHKLQGDPKTPKKGMVSIDMSPADALEPSRTTTLDSAGPAHSLHGTISHASAASNEHPPRGKYAQRLRKLRSHGKKGKEGHESGHKRRRRHRIKLDHSKALEMAKVAVHNPFDLVSSKSVGVNVDINSPDAAKRLAKTIFKSYRGTSKRPYLIASDFEPAFATEAGAKAAFAVFDRDGNGDVSQMEVKNTVLSTYKERRMLSRSMLDVNHAVSQLHRVFLCAVVILIFLEAMAIFNVDIQKTLSSFYSIFIAFGFIFKESATNLFDSIIFLFVTHPFDSGDRVNFMGPEGEPIVVTVKQMSLLCSVFVQWDNTELYVANSLLSGLWIGNYRRSVDQAEGATLEVAFDTPQEKLDAVEEDMTHWLSTEPRRMFQPSTSVVPLQYNYMRSIEVALGMTHRRNWQDWGARWTSRTAFIAAALFYCRKHGIRYFEAGLPVLYEPEELATLQSTLSLDQKRDSGSPAQRSQSGTFTATTLAGANELQPTSGAPRYDEDEHSIRSQGLSDPLQPRTPKEDDEDDGLEGEKTVNFRGAEVSSLYDHSFDEALRAKYESEPPTMAELVVDPGAMRENEGNSTGVDVADQNKLRLPVSASMMNFLPPPDEYGGDLQMRRRKATGQAQKLAATGGGI